MPYADQTADQKGDQTFQEKLGQKHVAHFMFEVYFSTFDNRDCEQFQIEFLILA